MKKSKASAITSFVFGVISIIPLINYITAFLAIYFGIKSLKNIRKHPENYGGKIFAITGLLLGILTLIFTLTGIGLCLAGFKQICKSMGWAFIK